MTTDSKIKVTNLGDLVALVPRLVGFKPEDSYVAVALQNGRVLVTARMDRSEGVKVFEGVLDNILSRFDGVEFYLLQYGGQDHAIRLEPPRHFWDRPDVLDVIAVNDDAWVSRSDSGSIPWDSTTSCTAVAAGLTVRPSRSDLEAMLDPVTPTYEIDVNLADELARISSADLDYWVKLARETQSPDVIGLAGIAAWLSGDGALANVCAERLPDGHICFGVLSAANEAVIPPSEAEPLLTLAVAMAYMQEVDA